MRKFAILAFVFSVGAAIVFQDDLESFIYKRSHHGLINYDYGILSVEDLIQSDKGSFSAKPFDGLQIGYPYWQCFNKKYLKLACNHYESPNSPTSSLIINIETKTEKHIYTLNHAISGESCDDLAAEITLVLKDQDYFCINGIDGSLDHVAEKQEYSWSFYGIKTKNGYANFRFSEM